MLITGRNYTPECTYVLDLYSCIGMSDLFSIIHPGSHAQRPQKFYLTFDFALAQNLVLYATLYTIII